MFKGLGDMAGLLKQAQQMQARMKEMQDKLAEARVTGASGGGMVTVEMSGQQKVLAVTIDPALMETPDAEVLSDLVAAATNDALDKSRELAREATGEMAGGMNIPGLENIVGGLGGS
ncbi:YbaB/EbfC family nucleoid-associated protein [Stratiformator vulcanicus]|uniref:Nucleoid-associated protein Pan189_05990 n=1 Tax=Stratiformator vulcanicus TaxID=2527980 RepID=A0A517QXB2_9PLAN|nr:YbaB/EbfC family nucleoid-associated protein [Stratiformator vulcanicus]QDT36244.1 Nucleoid-associated protein [Stratiformator vulcanicus]